MLRAFQQGKKLNFKKIKEEAASSIYNSIETNEQEEPKQVGRRTIAIISEEDRLKTETQEGASS